MNPQGINTAMEQAHTALRNLRNTFTAQEAHEVIAKANDVPVETGAELFAVMRVMGFIKDAKKSRMVSFDFTDPTREAVIPLFRAANPQDKKRTIDELAVGNLEAQHRAAQVNTKLRKALESCRSLFDDDYMTGVIDDALATEPLADDLRTYEMPKTKRIEMQLRTEAWASEDDKLRGIMRVQAGVGGRKIEIPYGSIQELLSYNWEKELADFESWKEGGCDEDAHIFPTMKKIQDWLDDLGG